jgi:hypothetical protein
MKNVKNIFTLLVVALVGLSLTGCSEDNLDTNPYSKSGVNIVGFGPSPILRTHEIRITGTNMNKVTKVIFPGDAIVERSGFNSSDAENIYVNVPDESVPGQIRLVAGNDTVTSVSKLTFEEPIEVTSVSPTTGLSAGDEITIKGDYVYNIAEVVFTSGVTGAPVPAEEFTYVSRKEIRLRVPLAAESGVITMNDGAEWELEWKEPLEIVSATATAVTPAETDFGQQIRITGTNLHIVETVMFPGGISAEFTVSDDHRTITTTVPAETKPGAITLLLYSGAAISTPEFTVPTVSITSVEPNSDLVEGDKVVVTGENFDRVKEVQLPGIGAITDYTISGNTLTFTVPEGMADGDVVLVQNSNISVTAAVEMRKLFGVIWQGKENLSGWSNWGVFNWDGDKWLKFQEAIDGPGELTFHFVVTNDNPAFNLRMGDWSTPFSNISLPYGDDGNIHPAADATDVVIQLSAEEREKMFADGGLGMVIWGDGIQLQYIKFVGAGAELVLWEGNEDMAGWNNNYTIGTDTSPELAALNAHEGSIVRFYGTATGFEGDNEWQVKIEEGHWGGTYAAVAATEHDEFAAWDLEANGGCIKLTLTQAMLDAAYEQKWWGGTFVVHGQNFILTKVTVADL